MIRLTKAGKIVVGLVAAVLLTASYFLFFAPSDQGPKVRLDPYGIPYTELVTKPIPPYKFPLSPEQQSQWHSDALANLKYLETHNTPLSYCNFMDDSPGGFQELLRRKPIEFVGIVGDVQGSPWHVANPGGSGKDVYPIYPIQNADGGADNALTALSGGTGSGGSSDSNDPLKTCGIRSPDQSGQDVVRPVLVQFPAGQVPSKRVIKVDGFVAGEFAPSNNLPPAPLVIAGGFSNASAQEVFAPTLNQGGKPLEFPLNIELRHGTSQGNAGLVLWLDKIQYAARQTRIFVRLINSTQKQYNAWSGATNSRLAAAGDNNYGQSICTGGFCDNDQAGGSGELADEVASGLLSEDNPIVPAIDGTKTVSGWMVFPKMDYGPTLTLSMPDLPPFGQDEKSDLLPLVVKIHPPK